MLERGGGATRPKRREELLETGKVLAKLEIDMVAKIIGSIVWTKKDLPLAVNLIASYQSDVGAAAVLDLSAQKTAEKILGDISMDAAKAFALLTNMKRTVQNDQYMSLALDRLGLLETAIAAAILDRADPKMGMKLLASVKPKQAVELLVNMRMTTENLQYASLACERLGKLQPDELAAAILSTATTYTAAKLIDSMGPARACTLLSKMAPSKACAVLSSATEERKQKYLQGMHEEPRRRIELCDSPGHKRMREANDDTSCCKKRRAYPQGLDLD